MKLYNVCPFCYLIYLGPKQGFVSKMLKQILFENGKDTWLSFFSSNTPILFKICCQQKDLPVVPKQKSIGIFLPDYSKVKLSKNKEDSKNFYLRKPHVPSMSLRHATSYFCIPSCFSLRSYHDISDVAFFYLLMDSSQRRSLLKSTGWNGVIMATLADVVVMVLILTTQQ